MSKPPLTTSKKSGWTRSSLRGKVGTRTLFRSGERIEDPGVLRRPFRSVYFILTSVMGVGCIALDGYILYRYWQLLSAGWVLALVVVVGVQVLYQVVQVLRVIPQIKEFDSIVPDENLAPDSLLGEAIEAAVAQFMNKLFFSYGITLGLLGVAATWLSLRYPA